MVSNHGAKYAFEPSIARMHTIVLPAVAAQQPLAASGLCERQHTCGAGPRLQQAVGDQAVVRVQVALRHHRRLRHVDCDLPVHVRHTRSSSVHEMWVRVCNTNLFSAGVEQLCYSATQQVTMIPGIV